jgi:hypothetical protein
MLYGLPIPSSRLSHTDGISIRPSRESPSDSLFEEFALALSALAAFTGSAFAADMAPRAYTKAPAEIAAVYDWTGFYVGANVGYG